MESVDSSCVEINECFFAYFNHIKRSSAHMATFRPSTPTFQILTRDLVTQFVVIKYFMYLRTHLGVERSSWIHRSPNFVRKTHHINLINHHSTEKTRAACDCASTVNHKHVGVRVDVTNVRLGVAVTQVHAV